MKILSFTFALALCIVGFGCEMHPLPQQSESDAGGHPKPSAELHEALQPEPANPNPPSFFSTPKPK